MGQAQLQFLTDQLRQAGTDRKNGFEGALIIAVHHPPFTGSEDHNPSPDMLDNIDQACKQAGVWPDAVLSGHAHLFERFTRYVNNMQVPFVVAGTAGYYNLSGFKKQPGGGPPPRPPLESQDRSGNRLVLEHYLDQNYGFLRLTAGKDFLSCEFVGVTDSATPGQTLDRFTVDLATHQLTGFRKS